MIIDEIRRMSFGDEAPASDAYACEKCGGGHAWQPRGNPKWFCWSCDPPFSPSMVGQERGQQVAVVLDEPLSSRRDPAGNYCFCTKEPCGNCRGHLVMTHFYTDGSGITSCWTCKTERDV